MARSRDRSSFFYVYRLNMRPTFARLEVRSLAFFIAILLLTGLAGWLYLDQASQVTRYLGQIEDLQQQRSLLREDIAAKRAEAAQLGSLEAVRERAVALGYSVPEAADETRYLRVPYQPLAETALATADASSQSRAEQPTGESGLVVTWQRLRSQLQGWFR